VKKPLVRTLSVSVIMLSCLTTLGLSACGKKGPLYLEKKQKVEIQDTKDNKNIKNKQTEK